MENQIAMENQATYACSANWIKQEILAGFSAATVDGYVFNSKVKIHGFSWTPRKCFVGLLFILLFMPGLVICDTCMFPARWTGSWFQKGTQDPIRIYNGTISNKGTCREVDGDKFLIQNTIEKCYRCVVLHEKHSNVLQYKETYCSTSPHHQSLENLCSEINGDALLYSMFRLHTPPVQCPFRGSFTFTYSRGIGICADPVSTIDSCTDDSHLLLRFQACTTVMGSESRVEELVCLAHWKEGSTRYLVGKLEHRVAKADEDKFRCFVYEQTEDNNGYKVAQSGDATCDGLLSATEGSRTMLLKKVNHPHPTCRFPEWFTVHRHWRVLDDQLGYDVSKNGSFHVSNTTTAEVVKRVVCTQEFPMLSRSTVHTTTPSSSPSLFAQYVVHLTYGCNSGYACLRLHKRAPHVVEVQISSNLFTQPTEACLPYNYEFNPADIVTLTTLSSGSLDCPLAGIYTMEGNHVHLSRLISLDMEEVSLCSGTTTLTSGCSAVDEMMLHHDCPTEKKQKVKTFQCRGSWEENGTNYVTATAVGTRRHLCLAYTETEKTIHISGSMEACLRGVHPGREGLIALNGTSKGLCRTSKATSTLRPSNSMSLLTSVILSILLLYFR